MISIVELEVMNEVNLLKDQMLLKLMLKINYYKEKVKMIYLPL